jgi:hypothetical protein
VTRTIKVATIGPSGVGKTSLITAIIDDAQRLLAGKPVSMVAIDETEALVHQSRDEARTALRWGEFKAGIEGSQDLRKYHIALRAGMGRSVEIPFDVLDYPGWWMSAEGEERQRIDDQWQSAADRRDGRHGSADRGAAPRCGSPARVVCRRGIGERVGQVPDQDPRRAGHAYPGATEMRDLLPRRLLERPSRATGETGTGRVSIPASRSTRGAGGARN